MATESGEWLQRGLRTLFEKRRHCDVTVVINNHEFQCHKAVLAASSGYFDALFGSAMMEAKLDTVSVSDVTCEIFNDMLKFIYGVDDVITTANVELLLHNANLFQISLLKCQCEQFLLQQLSPENCVGFWLTGLTYVCRRLEETSWQNIMSNFDQIRKFDELEKLEFEFFMKIIRDDSLYTRSEEKVCKAAMKWVQADESRHKYFPELLKEMRLCQVSIEFLLEEIFSSKLANYNEYCIKRLKDAVKYHALPERRHTFDSLVVRPRNSSSDVMLTVVLGRRQFRDGSTNTECIGYNDHDGKWYSICQLPVDLQEEYATCPYGNDIFVSGGTGLPNAMFYFSSKQFKWIEKSKMANGRYRHGMVAVKNSIFVVGGYNFGTVAAVEEYDIPTNSWETVGRLQHAVDAVSASAHGDKIYVFGGWKGFSDESSVIQCFDTATSTCSVVGNLPIPQCNICAVGYNSKTYLTFPNGEIHTFKPNSMTKRVHKIEEFNRKNFGVLKDATALYILGGCVDSRGNDSIDEENNLYQGIERVSTDETGEQTMPKELPVPMEVYGCFKTVVRQKYPLVEFNEMMDYMG